MRVSVSRSSRALLARPLPSSSFGLLRATVSSSPLPGAAALAVKPSFASFSATALRPPFSTGSREKPVSNNKTSVKFALKDSTGSLQEALKFFTKYNVNMTRVESRPAKRSRDVEFFVDFNGTTNDGNVAALIKDLSAYSEDLSILSSKKVPWFPRRIADVDLIANQVLDAGSDLQADHPGFHDPVYRARRAKMAENAFTFRHGHPIPRMEYSADENRTWAAIWDKLTPLLAKHACAEHVRMLPLLIDNCGYSRDTIPQIQDISNFLKDSTGFVLRPVAGLLSARNFLYGLAFRIFFSTQYIRHHAQPLYTPEPDVVHELMGHVPLFADQDFADFSQEIGLAAIGATDEQVLKLARCYWFSVEFGLCEQNGERKAYGAGLLSSFGELENSMSDKPKVKEWDPFVAGEQDYPITTYQPLLFQAKSFEQAKRSMHAFSESFARPFNVRYNPYTQSIEVDGNITLEPHQPVVLPSTATTPAH